MSCLFINCESLRRGLEPQPNTAEASLGMSFRRFDPDSDGLAREFRRQSLRICS